MHTVARASKYLVQHNPSLQYGTQITITLPYNTRPRVYLLHKVSSQKGKPCALADIKKEAFWQVQHARKFAEFLSFSHLLNCTGKLSLVCNCDNNIIWIPTHGSGSLFLLPNQPGGGGCCWLELSAAERCKLRKWGSYWVILRLCSANRPNKALFSPIPTLSGSDFIKPH